MKVILSFLVLVFFMLGFFFGIRGLFFDVENLILFKYSSISLMITCILLLIVAQTNDGK